MKKIVVGFKSKYFSPRRFLTTMYLKMLWCILLYPGSMRNSKVIMTGWRRKRKLRYSSMICSRGIQQQSGTFVISLMHLGGLSCLNWKHLSNQLINMPAFWNHPTKFNWETKPSLIQPGNLKITLLPNIFLLIQPW